jgi:hypothetical protein
LFCITLVRLPGVLPLFGARRLQEAEEIRAGLFDLQRKLVQEGFLPILGVGRGEQLMRIAAHIFINKSY